MPTFLSIDGVIVPEAEARVPVLDRGFLYGDSVFEVMRTYAGAPFAEREHLERLARSAERVLIRMPLSTQELSREVHATLEAAGNRESYVRIIVTRGRGPLNYDPTTATNPIRIVIVAPLAAQPPEHYDAGVPVCLVHASRPTDDERAAGVKPSNYLSNLLAVHEAKQRGGYEAILLSPTGEVLEGASSNVFIAKAGKLRTPPLGCRILAGITREHVLRAAREAMLDVEESILYPQDLYTADEVFITSTLREVMPVSAVDGKAVGSGVPGPLTQRLHRSFRRRLPTAAG